MLRRASLVVEAIALGAVVVAVLLLFTNQPTEAPAAPPAVVAAAGGVDAAAVYDDNCAGCHGGDGSGGIGPRLAGRMTTRFPDAADQIAVVAAGRAGMPAFSGRLDDEEIAAIVEYTRTVLGGG